MIKLCYIYVNEFLETSKYSFEIVENYKNAPKNVLHGQSTLLTLPSRVKYDLYFLVPGKAILDGNSATTRNVKSVI